MLGDAQSATGRYFCNWNTLYAHNSKFQTGVLAQEVQQQMPELVREDGNGTLSVSYTHMMPYLIESIKEQQKIAEAQRERIAVLKNELETLKNLIYEKAD